jgi:O-antigen/teichoic acid export membrane protein
MAVSIRPLIKSAAWTIGAFGFGQSLRLVTNIILARLLAPDLFGIMVIVNALITGVALLSDLGINQSLIYHRKANDPAFYNTAWTLQIVRGVLLWIVALAAADPVARFYRTPILAYVISITTFNLIISAFTSISRTLLQKNLQIAKVNAFEIKMSIISSALYISFAYFSPNIWALVYAGILGNLISTIWSYFLLPDVRERIFLSRRIAWDIIHYGRWIALSSMVYFLSSNFDRLYLAKAVPLGLLGIYGIARTISEMIGTVILRLGDYVLFPFVASHSELPRATLHRELAPIRSKFLAIAAVGFSVLVCTADLPIRILYDQRYQAATWMLSVLVLGSWFTILANINEYSLLGIGRPFYSAVSNSSKFVFLLLALPLGIWLFGLMGGILAIVIADFWRYMPIFVGQKRESFSFGRQDLLATLSVVILVGIFESVRCLLGFGTSFGALDFRRFF